MKYIVFAIHNSGGVIGNDDLRVDDKVFRQKDMSAVQIGASLFSEYAQAV